MKDGWSKQVRSGKHKPMECKKVAHKQKKYRGTSDQKHRPSGMFFHHSFSTDNDRMPSSG